MGSRATVFKGPRKKKIDGAKRMDRRVPHESCVELNHMEWVWNSLVSQTRRGELVANDSQQRAMQETHGRVAYMALVKRGTDTIL